MIDTIILHGRGTTESLKVGGKLPGQGSSLRFKMTEALLKDCTESEFINDARERCHPINVSQSCCRGSTVCWQEHVLIMLVIGLLVYFSKDQ